MPTAADQTPGERGSFGLLCFRYYIMGSKKTKKENNSLRFNFTGPLLRGGGVVTSDQEVPAVLNRVPVTNTPAHKVGVVCPNLGSTNKPKASPSWKRILREAAILESGTSLNTTDEESIEDGTC